MDNKVLRNIKVTVGIFVIVTLSMYLTLVIEVLHFEKRWEFNVINLLQHPRTEHYLYIYIIPIYVVFVYYFIIKRNDE
jgi:hypothetical protein